MPGPAHPAALHRPQAPLARLPWPHSRASEPASCVESQGKAALSTCCATVGPDATAGSWLPLQAPSPALATPRNKGVLLEPLSCHTGHSWWPAASGCSGCSLQPRGPGTEPELEMSRPSSVSGREDPVPMQGETGPNPHSAPAVRWGLRVPTQQEGAAPKWQPCLGQECSVSSS